MKRLLLAGWLLALGCGYALVGTGNILDPSLKTLYVPTFINRTTRVELEQRVTQSVADEFVSRGRLRLVNDPKEADIILKGSMDSFNLSPVGFDQGRATQYQISITANIELLDHRHEDKVLWKNDQYRFVENYQVNLETTDAFDQESRAIREIAQRFAQSLVANLLEGF
ncbi:MAG TPA: LptE family protein [Thermoanaerobaculia bacterium]|nr:LptE family protein [Thermoanaerobaculia bacterium]